MTRRGLSIGRVGTAALALVLAAPAFVPSALAQSTSDFHLPPGESPRPAGPVDPEPPAPTPTPAPAPTPTPSPTPAPPRIVLPPPAPRPTATARPTPRPTASAPAATTRPSTPSPRPTAAPTAAAPAPAVVPAPVPTAPAIEPSGAATASPDLSVPAPIQPSAPEAATPSAPESAEAPPWAAIAAGIGLVLAVALIVWLLRRGRAARIAAAEENWEAAQNPSSAPSPPSSLPPAPPGGATPPPSPSAPQPAFAPLPRGDFDMVLEPQRMTLAMINATFVYRLAIANRGSAPLGPIRITCDMISAHASLATAEQLLPDPAQAWLSHDFDAIPPGESIVIDGELRLPRAEIRPIHSGSSVIFAPLARFTLQTLANGTPALLGARVFVIGEEAEQPGGPVRPFRLNEGTRSYSRISQREVAIS